MKTSLGSTPRSSIAPISNSADLAVVSKNDLAHAAEFDWNGAAASIQSVRPGMRIFRVSAKTGEGMAEYLRFLSDQLAEKVRA